MATKDTNGRPYARLGKLKAGDFVTVDGGFLCMKKGTRKKVRENESGELYVACSHGGHWLDGQVDGPSDAVIGFYAG